jgi:aldose 1-epimerase
MAEIVSVYWEKLHALEMRAGDLRALVLPGFGGQALSLEDSRGPHLRRPENLAEYLALPEAYGLPVLFPPNRIAGNRFSARGRDYVFPPNRPGNLWIHGFLFERPWRTEQLSAGEAEAELVLSFTASPWGELFQWFPHPFDVELRYRLTGEGLFQKIRFVNRGRDLMPFMLGFHTAFALPGRDREPESFRITIPLGEELRGALLSPADPGAAAFRGGKILKKGEPVSGQFLAEPPGEDHEALIENLLTGSRLRYRTGKAYGYWVVWNHDGRDSFICIEPQTCAINAANLHGEEGRFGFRMLEPGEVFEASSSITLEAP